MFQFLNKIPGWLKNLLLLALIILSVIAIDKIVTKVNGGANASSQQNSEPAEVLGLSDAIESLFVNNPFESQGAPTQEASEEVIEDESHVTGTVLQSGWVPSWAVSTSIKTISNPKVKMDYILPVWYGVNTDGTLIDRRPGSYKQIEQIAKDKSIKIMPTVALFDADVLSETLEGDSLETHINAISEAISGSQYVGVDLDYESTYVTDKDRYNEFIIKLSNRLKAEGKLLSITVLSKWGDAVTYNGLPQTREVQDWEFLNQYADEIRIMTYDYHNSASIEAGPIAPITWQRDVLKYAVTKIDRQKIWLGVHLYGYEWSSEGYTRATAGKDISSITNEAEINMFTELYAEGFARYPCGQLQCTLYYQSQAGVKARNELAREFGIAGVAYWRLGDEADLLEFQLD